MNWKKAPDSEGFWWIKYPNGDKNIGAVYWAGIGLEISFGMGGGEISFEITKDGIPYHEFDGCIYQKVKDADE